MSLRARLAVVLTVTVLLPLAAAALVVGVVVPQVADEGAAERLEVSARSAAAAFSRQCVALGLAARSLGLDVAPRLAAGQPVPAESLDQAVAGLPGAGAVVLDAGGAVIASAGEPEPPADPERSCSRQVRPDGVQMESVPLRDSDGALVGVAAVGASLDAHAVDRVRREAGLPAGVLLAGADGEVLAAGVGGVGTTRARLEQVARAAGQPAAAPVTGEAAGLRFTALPPQPGVPGTVVAVEPQRTSFLSWAVPVLLVALAALAVAGTVLVARRLTAPLAELTGTVSRLGAGDLSTRSGLRGDDETGRLAAAVNAMADALERSQRESAARQEALADSLERFGDALARTHDLGGLLQTVAQTAAGEAGADTCVIYVADAADGRALVERAVVDLEVHSPSTRPALQAAARAAVAGGQEVALAEGAGLHLVALPLVHAERVLGAMVLAGRRRLDDVDLAAGRSLARPAGTAISNVLVHEEAARLSMTDALTGLANFRSLSETLAREVERAVRFGRPLSVLMLDLDHFKTVNDTWGHAAGDRVLADLAARLEDLVRDVDTVARYGGEEFAIVLPETAAGGAGEVAQRVVEAVRREPFTVTGVAEPLRVTVSVGVAGYPDHADSAAELMRRADQALYAAKAAGRDRWAVASGQGAGARLGG